MVVDVYLRDLDFLTQEELKYLTRKEIVSLEDFYLGIFHSSHKGLLEDDLRLSSKQARAMALEVSLRYNILQNTDSSAVDKKPFVKIFIK